ncbi:MAG: hypothetical protein WDN30_08105 [Pararobbsia sp.]
MNPITPSQTQSIVTNNKEDAQHLIEQLDALQPSKQQQKNLLFQQLYPAVERALGRQVPQKTVVAELEKMGLHLSIGGFRSLLEAERKQRNEDGERVFCMHCGSNLLPDVDGGNDVPISGVD